MPPQNRGGYQETHQETLMAIEEAVETMSIEGKESRPMRGYVAAAIWVSNVIIATNDTSQAWYLDSGATHHISNTSETLTNSKDYKGKAKVVVGNGSNLSINKIGCSSIPTKFPHKSLLLKDILHVPSLTKNLLSISQFTKHNNVTIEFDDVCCLVKDKNTKQALLRGTLTEGLYRLQVPHSPPTTQPVKQPPKITVKPNISISLQVAITSMTSPRHPRSQPRRLGHPSKQKILTKFYPKSPQY
uniref:Retrovirus-related Pol polyprotein from transposon TNT 1-94-like beta-barrel domain-containing protein n=1 Tax=Cannabis sativa TaxID=3483 RepID=A0A803PMV3_CANSA